MKTAPADIESQVLQADEARYQALYRQDTDALAPMLAEAYVHTHANGISDDKPAFLASIKAAKYRFVEAVRTEQRVQSVGSVAILSGKTRTTIDVRGEIKTMNNAFVTVWFLSDSGLRLMHWQATKLAEA